jgi:hypothetical protein
MKSTGEQIDDRTVEVRWDTARSHWRMMRFRDDKPNGNHRHIVEKIIQSIVDGVERDIVGAWPSNSASQLNEFYIIVVNGPFSCNPKCLESQATTASATADTTTPATIAPAPHSPRGIQVWPSRAIPLE